MTKKQMIEQMIKEGAQTEPGISYGKIMDRWLELTQDLDWTKTMGPEIP